MEDCIIRCIQSALAQDYPDFEVILVDNLSTDKTYKLVAEISDPRLKVFQNVKNLGAYGNHNRCLSLATGVWVKFLHGDDELLPNCLSSFYKAISLCPDNTALIGCGAINYSHINREVSRTFVPEQVYVMRSAKLQEFVLEGNFFGTPSMVLVHREKLLSLGGFDLQMEPASDGDCWINLRHSFPCACIPAHLVVIRDDHPGGMAQRIKLAGRFCNQIIRQIVKWHVKDAEYSSKPLRETFYAEWMIIETFRYWRSAIRFLLVFRPQLFVSLARELIINGLFFRSFRYFVSNTLRGKTPANFRASAWPVALGKLRIPNK